MLSIRPLSQIYTYQKKKKKKYIILLYAQPHRKIGLGRTGERTRILCSSSKFIIKCYLQFVFHVIKNDIMPTNSDDFQLDFYAFYFQSIKKKKDKILNTP